MATVCHHKLKPNDGAESFRMGLVVDRQLEFLFSSQHHIASSATALSVAEASVCTAALYQTLPSPISILDDGPIHRCYLHSACPLCRRRPICLRRPCGRSRDGKVTELQFHDVTSRGYISRKLKLPPPHNSVGGLVSK